MSRTYVVTHPNPRLLTIQVLCLVLFAFGFSSPLKADTWDDFAETDFFTGSVVNQAKPNDFLIKTLDGGKLPDSELDLDLQFGGGNTDASGDFTGGTFNLSTSDLTATFSLLWGGFDNYSANADVTAYDTFEMGFVITGDLEGGWELTFKSANFGPSYTFTGETFSGASGNIAYTGILATLVANSVTPLEIESVQADFDFTSGSGTVAFSGPTNGAAVPEPSSLVLGLFAFGGLYFVRRKKKNKKS